MKKFLFGVAAIVLFFFASSTVVHADNVLVNFENPPYVPGSVNGQDGWIKTGPFDAAIVANTYGYSTFGAQTLRISDAITSGSFGDQTFAKPLVNSVGETVATAGTFSVGAKQTHFEMQFDIASTMPNAQQPGMHMSVSPDRGDGSRMSYLRFEDQVDGIHVFFDDVTDAGPIGTLATFNESDIATLTRTPHTIKLTLDVVDGPANDVVKVWIDGVLKKTGTSWEDYYRYDPESVAEQSPRIVKTVLFRESGTANPADAGKGFLVDNFSLLSGPVLVGPLTSKSQCKNNGWKIFNNPSFKNQGQCIDYVEHHNQDKDHHDEDDKHGDDNHENDHDGHSRSHPED